MSRYSDQIRDEYERPVPGVSVYVYKWDADAQVAGDLETLTDDLGAPLANPLTSDADGLYYFNSVDGQKLLEYHYGGKVQERSLIQMRFPQNAPVNLARNSQWEIFTGFTYGPRWNALGTGTYSTAAMTSNTTGTNQVVITASGGIPSTWAVGELVEISGGTADAALIARPMRIQAKTGTTITVKCPFNLAPSATGTGTITPVNIGGSASIGTGDAADGWKKHLSTLVYRDDYATNRPAGATYSLAAIKQISGQEYVYHEIDAANVRGRTICFGMYVMQRVRGGSGTWNVFIQSDGTGGTTTTSIQAIAAVGAWQWIELSVTIPADATYVYAGAHLNGASGDAYYLANPVVALGTIIDTNNYVRPRESLISIVKLEPWINQSVAFPSTGGIVGFGYLFQVDFYADSGGALARTVKMAVGNIEGINTNAVVTGIGGSRLIGWSDKNADPIKLGSYMTQHATNVKCYIPLRLIFNDGAAYAVDAVSGDTWSNLSIDLSVFQLGPA